MTQELPEGTVTILFTDVVGSRSQALPPHPETNGRRRRSISSWLFAKRTSFRTDLSSRKYAVGTRGC